MEFTRTPWGYWEVFLEGKNYKVKRIVINPCQMISLQYHKHRVEIWTVVSGYGVFWVGKDEIGGVVGDYFKVEKEVHHRIVNPAENDILVVIEVQIGDCREDDIVRLDDIYGR